MVTIYILKLIDDKYYVGKTVNLEFRLDQHFNDAGSIWTKKYPPIKIVKIYYNADTYDEDKYTLKLMSQYGIENVRGGSFTHEFLSEETVKYIQKMIISAKDQCYKCEKFGHFAKIVRICYVIDVDEIIIMLKNVMLRHISMVKF